jgi:mono/diheme cytochrome c family protein
VRLASIAALAFSAFVVAGCNAGTGGVAEAGDTSRGKQLFTQKCAACHALKAAGATGRVGPDLDAAFGSDKAQGFEESTIRQVVADQIKFAGQYGTKGPTMPQNLVTGDDVDAVAAYVASVAGRKGAAGGGGTVAAPTTQQPTTTGATTTTAGGGGGAALAAGRTIFKTNCAPCHTLADAGTHGTVGPNLDQLKPDEATVQHQVENGGGGMPPFKGTLTAAQISTVAKYVSTVAGKAR